MSGGLTDDSLIDESGFDCFFTEQDMLAQQCRLLIDEVHDAWLELRRSRQHVCKLVRLNADLSDELAECKRQNHKLLWELSDRRLAEGLAEGRRLNAFSSCHGHEKR